MGLLSQLKSLFSPSSAPTSAVDQPAGEPPAMITVYDKLGRQFEISPDQWRTQVLPDQLAEAQDDPDALYTIIVGALGDGFHRDLLAASERLFEIDPVRERGHTVRGIVLLKNGDLDGAERVLTDYLDRLGPSGTVMTNLAKVQFERGLEAQAEATLWLALTHDPNQDNGLLWYCSLQQEKSGEEGLWEAMRRAAGLAGSWRPQLWLARRSLEQKNLAEARQYYNHVLDLAADEPEVLTMISGDLGNHGHVHEILDVVRPVYDPHRHDPRAGVNLLQAFLQTGKVTAGEELLHELFSLNRPDLRDHLFHYANEFGKLKELPQAKAPAPGEPVSCELLAIERPIWTQGLHDLGWLFPSAGNRGDEIVFLPLANTTASDETEPVVQREDDLGRLTRSLALYLTESAFFWTGYRSRTVIPVIRGGGPIVSGTEWPAENIFDFAADARFAVSGTVAQSGNQLRISLTLWDCTARESIRQFECAGPWDGLGSAVLALEQDLLWGLGGLRRSPAADFYRRPDAAAISLYLSCLAQSMTLSMVQTGIVHRDAIWGERNIFQSCLALVLEMPKAQVPKILFLGALAKGHEYGSLVYSEFKQQALGLLDEEQDRESPLYRLSPLLLKPFDMHRFQTRRAELLAIATGPYRAWLESLTEA
ncbi:MAG: hypothetical protein WD063_16535 [Pirellulales bacterium]